MIDGAGRIFGESPYTVEEIRDMLRFIPDFPHRGINFIDIMPLFNNPLAVQVVCETMLEGFISYEVKKLRWGHGLDPDEVNDLESKTVVDKVVAIESRGFLFGSVIACSLGVGFAPVRKPGKLPGELLSRSYMLEYGHGQLQMQVGAIKKGDKVLLVDDVLATGGTLLASAKLIEESGGIVVGISVFYEIEKLLGRGSLEGIEGYKVKSFLKG